MTAERTPLWDDNPSDLDLLGFDAVVAPIVDAIESEDLDPLTIGVHARWGGGKSTILKLVRTELAKNERVLVLETNPWEYDDHEDVKGTLIAEVLDALRVEFKDDGTIPAKITELCRRISWSRVGKTVAKGLVFQTLDFKALAEALTPKPRDEPETMAGFKGAFAEVVDLLPDIDRVVVLVDDLDRCMPAATVATLEAIKLFLSVPGMAFVIAADQDMVRDAIAMNLGRSAESSRFAQRYLEKIVQLPISLPYLPVHDAEAYIGLLLARSTAHADDFAALVAHAADRRLNNKAPLLGEMADLSHAPDDDVLRLASQLVVGLRSEKVVNPREIKRFLNAFQVRRRIAVARGVDVRADVLAKLLLLEDRYPLDFAALVNTPGHERPALLKRWEAWANGEKKATKPDIVSAESQEWAAAPPKLAAELLGPYVTLAASLADRRQVEAALDPVLTGLINDMAGDSEVQRRSALDLLETRSLEDQRMAMQGLFDLARRQEDGNHTISALIALAETTADLAQDVAAGLKEYCWTQIDIGNAVELAQSGAAAMKKVARELAADEQIDPELRQAVSNVLGEGSK